MSCPRCLMPCVLTLVISHLHSCSWPLMPSLLLCLMLALSLMATQSLVPPSRARPLVPQPLDALPCTHMPSLSHSLLCSSLLCPDLLCLFMATLSHPASHVPSHAQPLVPPPVL